MIGPTSATTGKSPVIHGAGIASCATVSPAISATSSEATTRIHPLEPPRAAAIAATARAASPAPCPAIAATTVPTCSQSPGWTRPTFAAATNAASQIRPPVTIHSAP